MNDIFNILFIFGVIFGACFIAELIAEYAPWVGHIAVAALILYGMSRLYKQAYK